MSDPVAAAPLAPTVSNFDAIVARNTAKVEAAESGAPDTSRSSGDEDAPDFYKLQKERESAESDDSPDLEPPDEDAELGERETEPEVDADPDAGVEKEIRAPLKALRAALKTKTLTPELMEAIGDLKIELKLPGGAKQVRISDLPAGYMLQQRFTREMEKAKDVAAQSENIVQIERARTQAWRSNPGELYRGLQAMGCEQTLQQVWHWMTEQRYSYLKADPSERQRIDYMRQVEAQRAQERMQFQQQQREIEQLRKGQQQQQVDPVTKQIEDHVLGSMDPALTKAFKARGISGRVTGHPQKLFFQHLATLSEGLGAESLDLIDQNIELAADLAAEAWQEIRSASHAEHDRKEQRRELPPKRAPAGTPPQRDEGTGRFQAPKSAAAKAKPKPTAEEFARRFGR